MKSYLLLLLPFWLSAASLSSLIENAKNTHMSLKAIEQRLSSLDDEYDASRNFADPVISLTINDIQFDNPSERSLEPMQYSALKVKQRIPYFGKRDAKSKKVSAKKEKINSALEAAKVELVKSIKLTAYSIWQAEEKIRITDEYIKLTKQSIELSTAYSSSDTKSHMGIMSAQLNLSQLKIKMSNLESAIFGLYNRISYLSAMKVSRIELPTNIIEPKKMSYYHDAISQNSSYKVKEAILKEANADIKVKELDSFIDPSIQLGYFHRESFNDYMSIGVDFSLPIYGTQTSKEEASRKISLSSRSEMNNFKNSIYAEVAEAYSQLTYSYKAYNIIQKESLPQIRHMFDLANASIKSGSELFIYIDMLQKKLALDEQSIDAVASYYITLSSLEAMIGEM
jgi:outer membrane protein TolC